MGRGQPVLQAVANLHPWPDAGRSSVEGQMAPNFTAILSGLVVITSVPNQGHVILLSEAPEIGKIFLRKSKCEQEENIETSSHFIIYLMLLSCAPNMLVQNSHKYSGVTSEPCM